MNTFARVRKRLAATFGIDEESITPETTLGDLFRQRERAPAENETRATDSIIDNLSPDSLDTIELVMDFEEEFDIEIPDEDTKVLPPLLFDKNTAVRQIVNLVDKKG